MVQLLELYLNLESQLQLLERRFVRPHLPLPPTSNPSDYDLDVRAYCMLSHAALEQYIDDVCLQLLIDAVDGWIETRAATNTLLALLAFAPEIQLDLNEAHREQTLVEYIRHGPNRRKQS